jgi:hypothetical protein
MPVDRLAQWKEFSAHMEEYISVHTVSKYGVDGIDLMSITCHPLVCIFSILKYALRIWTGNMKIHDLEKIAHYAQMAHSLTEGKIIKLQEKEKVPIQVLHNRYTREG